MTLSIMDHLKKRGWTVVSFDFPQSGTGRMIHPEGKSKNKGGVIPDIIAKRESMCILMENKPIYTKSDFLKIGSILKDVSFNRALDDLKDELGVCRICGGIGLPLQETEKIKPDTKELVDFVIGVALDSSCKTVYRKSWVP